MARFLLSFTQQRAEKLESGTVAAFYDCRFFLESTKYRRSKRVGMNWRCLNVVAGFSPRCLVVRENSTSAG